MFRHKDKDQAAQTDNSALIRASLRFGFQGALAAAHITYALTRYGVSVRDAGAVERVLNDGKGLGAPSTGA